MIFFFDFDHTLFDTARLRRDIERIFLKGGVKRASFHDSYQELTHCGGYGPDAHAELLAAEWRDVSARESAMSEVAGLMDDARVYVFEGAAELLQALKQRGHRLIILTLGNGNWQRAKIASSGLADLFDQTEIVSGPGRKASRLVEITSERETVTIIDDNPGELKAVMAVRPGIRCIYFCRPINPYPNPGCEEVNGMAELSHLLLDV